MKKCLSVVCTAIALLCMLAAPISATNYTTPGTYAPADNCGLTVLGSDPGWVEFLLLNDTASLRTMLWVLPGEQYPLRLRELHLPGFGAAPAGGVNVDNSANCGYTRSFNIDSACEFDSNRPELANPEEVPRVRISPSMLGFTTRTTRRTAGRLTFS